MKITFQIGDREVHGLMYQKMSSQPIMVNVHEDETTSVMAGKANINAYGGRMVELAHSGTRRIKFGLEGQNYEFDPNRIFSDAGTIETLTRHSQYSTAAHAQVKKFANDYLDAFALNRQPVILALHNTTDGIFSVKSFAPGDHLSTGTAAIHISPHRNKFDFFYVTDATFFEKLKLADFNVVLQDNQKVPDDGSLSVHFARQGIPYINIEAQMTHLHEQIEMLRFVRKVIGV